MATKSKPRTSEVEQNNSNESENYRSRLLLKLIDYNQSNGMTRLYSILRSTAMQSDSRNG